MMKNKKEVFDLYQKVKNCEINLEELNENELELILKLFRTEIDITSDKLRNINEKNEKLGKKIKFELKKYI